MTDNEIDKEIKRQIAVLRIAGISPAIMTVGPNVYKMLYLRCAWGKEEMIDYTYPLCWEGLSVFLTLREDVIEVMPLVSEVIRRTDKTRAALGFPAPEDAIAWATTASSETLARIQKTIMGAVAVLNKGGFR